MSDTFAGIPTSTSKDQQEDYGRWLIHGPQGSGKTTLASTIAELGPTLYLDLRGEKGTRSFRNADYADNITIIRPNSITALDDVYWALAKDDHPYKAVVIDSLTSAQKMAMRFMLGYDETAVKEIRQGVAPADQRTWGQTLDIMTDIATFWYELADGQRSKPMHVVMTAQTKVADDEIGGGGKTRTPDVQKGALPIMLACPDYVLYTDLEQNMEALGDESIAAMNHVVRFGANSEYRTKARVPVQLRGKIPNVLGRKEQTSLAKLSRVLGIGGVPTQPRKAAAAAQPKEEK